MIKILIRSFSIASLHTRTRFYYALVVFPGPSLVFARKLPTCFTVLFPVKYT